MVVVVVVVVLSGSEWRGGDVCSERCVRVMCDGWWGVGTNRSSGGGAWVARGGLRVVNVAVVSAELYALRGARWSTSDSGGGDQARTSMSRADST